MEEWTKESWLDKGKTAPAVAKQKMTTGGQEWEQWEQKCVSFWEKLRRLRQEDLALCWIKK